MWNAENQRGDAGNGVGVQRIRVEPCGKLVKNVGKEVEMRHTRR